ncbi:hypothetical protein Desku_0062 [Desulfofundulus kuznetsovii DSM 6115]|uniref:Uncharacterized protein n=1 Tax=Desulfofundulus kuznetsovii (strain DSM 6115 / VKM B-1805 / 17) TaxID=760568 RepID=A0AAU8P7S1_DESK7|nr:hypothetical protein Desku_0062 [Desulfofundulus kuznetsovii DSM 6115]
MAKVEIFGGICGFNTVVSATAEQRRMVELKVESECPNWQKVQEQLKKVDAYKELFGKLHEGEVYRLSSPFIPHLACLVPAGIMKAVEVAAGLALPRDGFIRVTG